LANLIGKLKFCLSGCEVQVNDHLRWNLISKIGWNLTDRPPSQSSSWTHDQFRRKFQIFSQFGSSLIIASQGGIIVLD